MFNFSKVGEKIAIIDKSLKYKRKNKIYMNNSKDTADDQFIKQFDNITLDEGEFMLSPDKDQERTTMMYVDLREVANRILWLSMFKNITKRLKTI